MARWPSSGAALIAVPCSAHFIRDRCHLSGRGRHQGSRSDRVASWPWPGGLGRDNRAARRTATQLGRSRLPHCYAAGPSSAEALVARGVLRTPGLPIDSLSELTWLREAARGDGGGEF